MDPERFDALERAGFKTERYGDIAFQVNEKLGGHYMDVGASAKIAKGLVCSMNMTLSPEPSFPLLPFHFLIQLG